MSTQVDECVKGGTSIEKNDFSPVYLQIKQDLKDKILAGVYEEDAKLPSENELVKTYNVTRTTVQRALAILVNDGLIEKVHGKGSYVRLKTVRENIWNFSGFSKFARQSNQVAVTKVIKHDVFQKDSKKYLKLVRLRGIKKQHRAQWMTLDTSVLSLVDYPKLDKIDFSQVSLYETLETSYQVVPHNAQLTIEAIISDKQLNHYFELQTSIPLLQAKGNVFAEKGQIIEWVEVVYSPQAKFNFVTNI